jgi:hypothetical protein
MSLIFWIALGSAIAALIIGLILKARLGDEQVWEELVDSNTSDTAAAEQAAAETTGNSEPAPRTDIPIDSAPRQKFQGEAMNTFTPAPSPRDSSDADLRRSSRIERAVPLVVLATNRRGETFQERTSAVAVNLHGCRYSSRHDIAPEGWVTLQVTGTDGAGSHAVRARVRSVLSPQTSRELCQVGVELETPGNVWGIPAPPEDWQRVLGNGNSGARAATAVAPALDPSAVPTAYPERQPVPPERRAEVTVFPGPPTPPAAPSAPPVAEAASAKDLPAPTKERVVVTADQLLQALQGKIQGAADKAVQASLSEQLDEAVKNALGKIEDGRKTSVRQTEEFSAARLAETQSLWEKELVIYRSRAEEISRRMETLTANSQQALTEIQRFIERFAGETVPQFHARITDSYNRASAEFEAKAAQASARHLAQLSESSQLAALEARSQLDETIAEVRSLLSTAGGGVSHERFEQRLAELSNDFEQQQDLARQRTSEIVRQFEGLALTSRQTRTQDDQSLAEIRALVASATAGVPQEQLDAIIGSLKEELLSHLDQRLAELFTGSEKQHELARQRTSAIARDLETLSGETRQLRNYHEQSFIELRSLLANANTGLPAEQIDPLLDSSREETFKHLEWRLGEVSDRFEHLLGLAHQRAEELAQRVESLSFEMRDKLAEAKTVAERAPRELQPQDLVPIEQSVYHATKEFETTAARISDRQLVRLLEQKQVVSQEVSLELEARASEVRALLQKAANNTLEEFRRRVENQIDIVIAEATERLNSSIASLDAESRASGEARRRAMEADVARTAEQSTLEFRSGIKAFLYSCLVAAVSAVDQHAQTTLAGFSPDSRDLHRAIDTSVNALTNTDDPAPAPPKANSAQ